MANIFRNLIAILAIGGALAMLILAWPFIENLFYIGLCALPLVLGVGFAYARLTEWRWRGDTGRPARGYSYGNSEEYRAYHDRLQNTPQR